LEVLAKIADIVSYPKYGYENIEISYDERKKYPFY